MYSKMVTKSHTVLGVFVGDRIVLLSSKPLAIFLVEVILPSSKRFSAKLFRRLWSTRLVFQWGKESSILLQHYTWNPAALN